MAPALSRRHPWDGSVPLPSDGRSTRQESERTMTAAVVAILVTNVLILAVNLAAWRRGR